MLTAKSAKFLPATPATPAAAPTIPRLAGRLAQVKAAGYCLTGWIPAEGEGFRAVLCGPDDLRAGVGRDGLNGRRWDSFFDMEGLAQAAEDARDLWPELSEDEALALMIDTLVEAEEVRRV